MATLQAYRSNIFSQNGEDGVLQEILKRLIVISTAEKPAVCVEFGAWDGKHLSNTYNLVKNHEWHAVYIEADANRYQDLLKTVAEHSPAITPVNALVQTEGESSLDAILLRTGIPKDFELLSIDIDSFDWQIWHSLKEFCPKIVVIEINSGLAPGIFQIHRGGSIKGSSFSSTVALGKEKGYTPVLHTGNIIFIRDDIVCQMNMPADESNFFETLFDYSYMRTPQSMPTRILSALKRHIK